MVLGLLLVGGCGAAEDEARVSATAPSGPYHYVEWEYRWNRSNAIDRELQIWAGSADRYEQRSFEVEGEPAGKDDGYFDRASQVSCVTARKGAQPRCERLDPEEATPGRDRAVELWLEAPELSADPDRLLAALEEQIMAEYEAGLSAGIPTTGPIDGVSGFSPSGSFEELARQAQRAILAEESFAKLVGVLSNPQSSPELRAAALTVLRGLDGAELARSAADGRGRDAVKISFAPRPPSGTRLPGGESYGLFIDPTTSEPLEMRIMRGGRLVATESVLRRRDLDELPAEALALREAAQAFESTVPESAAEPLPVPTPGPAVELSAGPGWELVVTDDRAIEMRRPKQGSVTTTAGFANPPTLAEAESYPIPPASPTAERGNKILAGPVPGEVDSVSVDTSTGEQLAAELVDAFDLRWFWLELGRGESAEAITARDGEGETVAKRVGHQVVRP